MTGNFSADVSCEDPSSDRFSYDGLNWHNEGGRGMMSEIVKFQIRPYPLAE